MRTMIAVVLVVAAVAVGLKGIRQNQGPKPNEPCRACVTQGPKPEGPCKACVTVSAIDWSPINVRMTALLNTHHPIHVGGDPE